MSPSAVGLREELRRLERAQRLVTISNEISPRFETCAYAARTERTILFERVTASSHRVVMNTTASRESIAVSLGVAPEDMAENYLQALSQPIAPVERRDGSAPALPQQVRYLGNQIDLLKQLPILTHHEHDGGPYITSGVVIGEQEGVRNLSYHRMQVRGPRETGIVVVQRHLHRMLDIADAENRPLPIAIALGLDAAMYLAAATSGSAAPYGFDELGIVGALRGAPVELVPGITVPVGVPSCAEIILEGHILPNTLAAEGPFAEFDGNYESGQERVFRASGLTMRHDAIYHGLVSGSTAQLNIMGLPNEAVILRSIRAVVPTAAKVNVTLGGLRKFHAIISVNKQLEADPGDIIVAAFAGHRDLKQVIVVDHDVDVFDPAAVERAMSIYFQAHEDLHIFRKGRGNPVDRSLDRHGMTSRMGIDATRPHGDATMLPAVIPGVAEVPPF